MPQMMVYHFCITEFFIGVLKVTYLYLLHLPSLQNAIGLKKKKLVTNLQGFPVLGASYMNLLTVLTSLLDCLHPLLLARMVTLGLIYNNQLKAVVL